MTINQQPNGIRKSLRLIIVLSILAWVAQSMLNQFGYGAEPRADTPAEPAPSQSQEKFIATNSRSLSTATLELRGEATVVGGEVKLKQICRWADADQAAFEPIADLVIARMGASVSFRAIGLVELKTTLHDAGVNLAVIRFAGTTSCTINRSDVATDERASLQEWVSAQRRGTSQLEPLRPTTGPAKATTNPASFSGAQPAALVQTAKATAEKIEPKTNHSLRELLITDLAERLSIDPASLQMKFNPIDERLLNLTEPQFRFNVDGQRALGLGTVSWDVTIVTDNGNQKTTINANARAWQEQLLVTKPMAFHQTIRNEDLTDHRTLVEYLNPEPAIKRDQAVGQMAGRELQAGTILTSRMVEASPLVKTGQLVTVTVEQGHVQITSAARAMEGGSYGQVIKVRNEATNNIFEVTITGSQAAKMSPTATERTAPVASGN